jgi:hypothetical protein
MLPSPAARHAYEAAIVGRTLYVHTPDGFGNSELAEELLLKRRRDPLATGTLATGRRSISC